jgi:hypothetical protein
MRTALLTATVVSLILGSGCADPVGDLAVGYQVSAGAETCADLGIVSVEVILEAPDQDPISSTTSCVGASGQVSFNDVPVNVYTITVNGLDASGFVIYTGSRTGVSVSEGVQNTADGIGLSVTPPTLSLEWGFTNGGMCTSASVNVDEIDVRLWIRGAGMFGETYTVGCQDLQPFIIDDGLMPGDYDVQARGRDAGTGLYTYQFNSVDILPDGIPLRAGQPQPVLLRLSACVEACEPF